MREDPTFKLGTALVRGLRELLERLENRLQLKSPLQVYLAGGMAVHLYTGKRVTGDVDAEFGGRVLLPSDLAVVVTLEDGTDQVIYLDTNYNPTFALMHEDYQVDSRPVQKTIRPCPERGGIASAGAAIRAGDVAKVPPMQASAFRRFVPMLARRSLSRILCVRRVKDGTQLNLGCTFDLRI